MGMHPDRKALKGFVSGELSSEEARRIENHLSLCSECRDQADAISEQLALQLLDSWLRPGYDEAFERAADRTAECLTSLLEESRNTEDLLAELLREPAPLRRRKIAEGERFHSLKFCQLLVARSLDARQLEPAAVLEMADLAVEVAQNLDSRRYGSSLVEDALALAWVQLASGFRITSDFWRAEQALRQAWCHHSLAEGDAYTEARLLIVTSSLRYSQDRYEEAVKIADKAIDIHRDTQDGRLEGAALNLKGIILECLGRPEQATLVIRAGLDRIDPAEDPWLSIAGTNNLISSLIASGVPVIAQKLLAKNRHLYQSFGEIIVARLHWLEGAIARELGQFSAAESLFIEVREFFGDRCMWSDVLCASLDLASLYTITRQPKKVKKILNDVIPFGRGFGSLEESLPSKDALRESF